MQIILLTKTGAAARVLSFGRRWPLVAGLLLGALLSAGLFRAGYVVGHQAAQPELAAVSARTRAAEVQRAEELAATRRTTDHHLNALALRLGELQAHVIRLGALGERLVNMADLNPIEFDFSSPPARGGPAPSGSGGRATAPPEVLALLAEKKRLHRNVRIEQHAQESSRGLIQRDHPSVRRQVGRIDFGSLRVLVVQSDLAFGLRSTSSFRTRCRWPGPERSYQ